MPRRGKWSPPGANSRRGGRGPAIRGKNREPAPTTFFMGAPSHGFSMRDEARNTASHQSSLAWSSGDAKLRQKPVTFVSAGVIEPLKDLQPPDSPKTAVVEEAENSDAEEPDGNSEVDILRSLAEAIKIAGPDTTTEAVEETIFIADQENIVIEEESIITQGNTVTEMEKVITEKEEIVTERGGQAIEVQESETKALFFFDLEGNDTTMHGAIPPPPKIPFPRSSFGGSDSSEEVILFRGRSANTRTPVQRNASARPSPPLAPATVEVKSEAPTGPISEPLPQNTAPSVKSSRKRSKSHRRSSRPPMPSEKEEDDEDEILADYIANMAENPEDDFISQALARYRDLGGDDDAVNFGSEDDAQLPEPDQFLDLMDREVVQEEESISSESEKGEDSTNEDDDQDMDADMDDETLARLLAKQEELGIGGDELVLSSSFANVGRKKRQGKYPRALVSASQAADAFDDLDHWGDHFLQPRKRKSKQPPNFNVSDSEIEAVLRNAWQRDRVRKKNRKMEREALRAEGLLDKHADPDDLRVKYREGMKLDDIKSELTSFLLGSAERLDFPPLDKHARKVLHELANKFNIKSQSTGKGDQRRPVLYRTNRTVRFASTRVADAANHVHEATMRIHRKYFHRVDVKAKPSGSPKPGGGGGRAGSGHKALTLREGEIVGASVPELGQENKGRAMLEKMGWSKGMALGSTENKGILEPVAQVMKRSKAGLG